MIRRIACTTAVFAAMLATIGSGAAQSPTAVKAAQDATRHAQAVTYALLDRTSGATIGSVTLQRIGSTRSRVRVTLTNPALGSTARLRPGSDCTSPRVANAPHSILLNPFTGRVSETVVSLPISNLQSGNYLLDVQNATERQAAIDACARIASGQP
ncbi:MAG TPA: hypothetical protein VHT53_03565 [Candidatus Elarobacter sp.]|jgi:hypothetical protein|nr:hypothetical protein [Candidatus Elarobacter sp.]